MKLKLKVKQYMTLSLFPDVSLFINCFTEKKHQYQQNFFKNLYIPNLTVSKTKAVLFNILTKKVKKKKKFHDQKGLKFLQSNFENCICFG